MKRALGIVLVLIIGVLTMGTALADGASIDNAYILEDAVYYAGSIDGETVAVYRMGPKGADPQKIVDGDYALLAVSNGNLLLQDWEAEELVIVDANGAELYRKTGNATQAVAANGWFYLGASALSEDGAQEKTFVNVSGNDVWQILPATATDSHYYYLDRREYGEQLVEYSNCSALYRASLADGAIEEISPPGTNFIGLDEQFIYYTRQTFFYYDEASDDAINADVNQGLFKYAIDGSGETKLADSGELSENLFTSYKFLDDGVLYGMRWDFGSDEVQKTLLRTAVSGEALPELPIEEDALHGVKNGRLIVSKYVFIEDPDAYHQADQLAAIDLQTNARTVLNTMGQVLYFTESDPFVAVVGDRAYYMSYDETTYATGLYVANLDGSGASLLAQGVSR